MAKRTKRRGGGPAAGVRLTRQRLVDGLPTRRGTRVRVARPGDRDRMAELLALATPDIEQPYLDAVAAGRCGEWLLDGVAQGPGTMTEPLVRAALRGHLPDAALSLSLPLVAEDEQGALVGALLALPPGMVAQMVRDAGYEQHVVMVMLKYVKLKAVAVAAEARGRGVGGELLRRCTQLYWQLDFMLLYGEFNMQRALGPYYSRHGFTVLEPGETTDVGYILTGRPMGLGAGPGEQLFYRWKTSPPRR